MAKKTEMQLQNSDCERHKAGSCGALLFRNLPFRSSVFRSEIRHSKLDNSQSAIRYPQFGFHLCHSRFAIGAVHV